MNFWMFVKYYIGAKLLLVLGALAIVIVLVLVAGGFNWLRERLLSRKYDIFHSRVYTYYVAKEVYIFTLAKCQEVNSILKNAPELFPNGYMRVRAYATNDADKVGVPDQHGGVLFIRAEHCTEQNFYKASGFRLLPEWLTLES